MRTLTKKVLNSLILTSIFCFLSSAFCQSQVYADIGKGPVQKLGRGIFYIVASPFQIPKEIIQKAAEADRIYLAAFKGVAEGAGSGVYQTGRQVMAGVWDVLTFWTPAGRNWGPLFESISLFPEV